MSCMCENLIGEKKIDDVWYVKQDGIELELSWKISSYDIPNRIRHVDFRMKGTDNGKCFIVEEPHELRLWIFEEFKMIVEKNGFKIIGVYDQNYQERALSGKITGELGALFFVLKKV